MRKNKKKKNEEASSFWQSYSDMMAALLLVFILIITVSMFMSKNEMESNQKSQGELEEARLELERAQLELENARGELEGEKKANEEKTQKLQDQQEQIDQILGIKSDIVSALKDEFKNTNLALDIDSQTGSITLDTTLQFEKESATLTQNSKDFLDTFLPKYFATLLKPEFQEYISEIIIEGHTAQDDRYTYFQNMQLSQSRAYSVAAYALRDGSSVATPEEIEYLKKVITVNGRSSSVPKYDSNGNYSAKLSRRVEIKFRLKDDELIQNMLTIFDE